MFHISNYILYGQPFSLSTAIHQVAIDGDCEERVTMNMHAMNLSS
jgi:hypothetical protein